MTKSTQEKIMGIKNKVKNKVKQQNRLVEAKTINSIKSGRY